MTTRASNLWSRKRNNRYSLYMGSGRPRRPLQGSENILIARRSMLWRRATRAVYSIVAGFACFLATAQSSCFADTPAVKIVSAEQMGVVWFMGIGGCKLKFSIGPRDWDGFMRFRVYSIVGDRTIKGDFMVVEPGQNLVSFNFGRSCERIGRVRLGSVQCARDIHWRRHVACPFRHRGGVLDVPRTKDH